MENKTTTIEKKSLYERLGGESGVKNIVNDVLDKNRSNPLIGHHFQETDMARLKQLVFEFFSMGTGGPHQYTGRDMRTSHAGLNITEEDFLSANEDTLQALEENGIGEAEKNEVIAILNSMKGDVVRK
ncbi:group I truncated hemoglobin [Flavitalea antarctica]